jgi:Transposase Tn5 dimerisation domain
MNAVIKWASILAAVATRIERLKYLSRHKPDEPATIEFADEEIEALRLDQRRRTRPARRKLPEMPTIAQATRWAAELGGWIGERNGPPGSITLARGLARLSYLVEGIAIGRRGAMRKSPMNYPT